METFSANHTKIAGLLPYGLKQARYRQVVALRMNKAGVKYHMKGSRAGYRVMVTEQDHEQANRIILGVSYTNPQP